MDIDTTMLYRVLGVLLGVTLICVVYRIWKAFSESPSDYPTPLVLPRTISEERRAYPRVEVNWSVSMETSTGIVIARIKNISLGGAFICCEKPLPIGEMFSLTMTGPDNELIPATAQVVWSNVGVPSEKVINRGMGVRFLNMSDKHIQLVRHISSAGS
jgi:uncharacterized protein (TIGR02266 family)